MRVNTEPADYPDRAIVAVTVHALRENKRPIGFAAWPEEPKQKKKRKKKRD